jgi:hypothetical protein
VIFAGARRLSGSPAVALFAVLAVFVLGAPRLQILRPDVMAFLFFATTLLMLIRAGGGRPWFLWLLAPLFVVWANVHASVVIGPPIVGIFLLAAWRWPPPETDRPPAVARFIAVLTAVLALAPMLNPHAYRIYLFPFEHLMQRYSVSVTNDWAGLSWTGPRVDLPAWGLAALAVACLALAVRERHRLHLPLAIVAALCALPGFAMMRFVPFAAIALALLAASLLRGTWVASRASFVALLVIAFAAPLIFFRTGPLLGLSTVAGKRAISVGRPMGVGFDGGDFPVEAVDFIDRAGIGGRFFNDMAWGGFLIWRRWPGSRVFIDTRTPVYGDAFIRAYADALFDPAAFEKLARDDDLTGVLYDAREMAAPGGPLTFLLSDPRWKPVFRSHNAIVLLRATP